MKQYFPQIAAVLALIAPVVYIRAILRGEAKPHRTTRFVLMVITFLTVTALFAHGDRVSLWLAAASAIQAIVIFGMSIKYGMGGGDKVDILCLVIAMLGVVLWQITNEPILALYFGIAADFVGGIPLFIKTWRDPDTEVWSYYAFDVVGSFLILLAITTRSVETMAYPFYIFAINLFVIFLIKHKQIGKYVRELV